MKKPKGGFWKIAASCVVAASLVFGISALPAFAGEDAAGTDCSRSEEESAAEEETEHDWLIPGEGVTIVDDAEEEEGDANPFTKLPDVVFGETVNMFGNVMGSQYRAKSNVLRTYSDDSDDSESEAPNPIVMDRPVDDMSISVYKRWYEDTAQTRPSEITVEIFGYTLEEDETAPVADEIRAYFENKKYINENDEMAYFDANGDEKGSLEEPDELDAYFDMNADGQIGTFEYTTTNDQGEDVQVTFDERASEISTSEGGLDNRIVAPYYYDKVTLKGDSENAAWRFNIDNTLPRYFYEYTSPTDVTSTDEDGNEVTTTYSSCVPVIDEDLQPQTREFHYVVRETTVDGYETSYDDPGSGSVSPEGDVTYFSNSDGKDYIVEVGIKNTKVQPGSLMITKHFSDTIWVGDKANNQTANENVTVVFHVEAVETDDEGNVIKSVDPISYGYYGMTFTADDGSDDKQTITVNNLPVGKSYRVTEVTYPGCGYVLAKGPSASKGIKLEDAKKPIVFEFENVRPDGAGDTPNSGIVNTYEQNTDGSGYTVTNVKKTTN